MWEISEFEEPKEEGAQKVPDSNSMVYPTPGNDLEFLLKGTRKHKLLTQQEENQYTTLAQQGDLDARNKLINSNILFVIKIARKHARRGLDVLDLVQEGILGLMHAITKFEPEKGFRFTTYSYYWILHSIKTAIYDRGRLIKFPRRMAQEVANIYGEINKNVEVSIEELAKKLELEPKKIEKHLGHSKAVLSYDAEMDYEGHNLLEVLPDENSDFDEIGRQHQFKKSIIKLLSHLNKKERTVVTMRFGLLDDSPKTLREVGEFLHLSRERIRQIENRVLKKMKKLRFPNPF
jgi:RNA polymerase sigma factor (sigma-70 family)